MSLVKASVFALATFESTGHAMAGEQEFKNNNLENVVIPLPTAIAASCGLAIRFWPEDIEKAHMLLKNAELEFHIYEGVKDKTKEKYELVEF